MIMMYIHRSLLSERVWNVISAITLEGGAQPNEFGYIGIRGDNIGMPKILALKADVIVDSAGFVLKTPLLELGVGATLPDPAISWDLLKSRLAEEFELEGDGLKFHKTLKYLMAPVNQTLSEEDMKAVRESFALSMTPRKVHDDLDDVLLDENGCSKSSDGVVMLDDNLVSDLKGKDFLCIGGSLFTIKRVGNGFNFTYVPQDLILEM
ncbi:hypothetical protein VPHK356_0107 [Vibrio phage K356]|nr:hypothetical protein MYOV002v2_p0099 [Vibrio phage 144E46.1]